MTTSVSDSADMILLGWAAGSLSLTLLLLFSLSEMTMRMSLLHTEQQHAWSHHLQLLQHSLKCFDVQWHFKKSVISCFWQLVQSVKINTSWLWIKIALMYDSWWVLIWADVIQFCTNKMLSLSRVRMTIVWEKWAYKASCCWSTQRTELTLMFTRMRTAM